MSTFTITDTVGSIVTRSPGLSRVFEQAGIDYCCGGKVPLGEACRTRGLDPQAVLASLEAATDAAGAALARLRELTDGFTPPDWACNTYRALLEGFAHLERDLHQHVHKENNVLFPRAIEMEERKAGDGPGVVSL